MLLYNRFSNFAWSVCSRAQATHSRLFIQRDVNFCCQIHEFFRQMGCVKSRIAGESNQPEDLGRRDPGAQEAFHGFEYLSVRRRWSRNPNTREIEMPGFHEGIAWVMLADPRTSDLHICGLPCFFGECLVMLIDST